MNIETNMAAFNSTLAQYMALTSKTPDEVLDKKGRDLGIRLYQKFSEHKYGGPGAKRAGLAKLDLRTRTSEGIGTRVRGSLIAEYLSARSAVRSAIASFIGPRTKKSELRTIKQRVGLWQSFVGREVAARQRGIGVLAASFLWFRRRSSQARGTYFVRNRTGRPLGYVERGDGYLRIVGETEGLAAVDARYGIVSSAIIEAKHDMIEYINRKQSQLAQYLWGGSAA